MKPFLDTNVLVYAALSDDPRCPIAERLLTAGGTISVQVLNEFANVLRTKLRRTWQDTEAALADLAGVLPDLWFDADIPVPKRAAEAAQ